MNMSVSDARQLWSFSYPSLMMSPTCDENDPEI